MNVLVTGAGGFIGRNLVERLRGCDNRLVDEILQYDRDTDSRCLADYCARADFVFHLAGVNRPSDPAEFGHGNADFTTQLIFTLEQHENPCPVLFTSSTQATMDNPYGRSKLLAEGAVFDHGLRTGAKTYVCRLPGVFGKWCRPNYNSVVATFCHNIARGLPITIDDPSKRLDLAYIDDVVTAFVGCLKGDIDASEGALLEVGQVHSVTLEKISQLLDEFRASRETLDLPDVSDPFAKRLYSTYLSYLPANALSYSLKMNTDDRGSFTEVARTADRGQFSINVVKPGIVKGNHWHNTKTEKFVVVSGTGVVRLRSVDSVEVHEYPVCGERIQVVDIPPGYTHHLENLGSSDMVVLIWCNEPFDPVNADTCWLPVREERL